ncbi:Sec-independent protein translocase protein TatB [Corynebacterium mendelii]|uniref:Sec-independent protein translocase protein TatB n=1 Tax=Corynebacterium mendelii TaxID=2765362 RepID=A0A939E0U1_9CORY|nr:twin-arginine translocase subunit TatB [Corynebacterium mendelii]
MFSSIGWPEIFTCLVIGLIVIGPERLPRVVEDVRAAIIAARRAIDNVKQELNEEVGDEFRELAEPIGQIAQLRAMGPKAALTKTLLDGDTTFLDSFDPNKIMSSTTTAGQAQRARQQRQHPETSPETVRIPRPSSTGKPTPTAGSNAVPPSLQSTQQLAGHNNQHGPHNSGPHAAPASPDNNQATNSPGDWDDVI